MGLEGTVSAASGLRHVASRPSDGTDTCLHVKPSFGNKHPTLRIPSRVESHKGQLTQTSALTYTLAQNSGEQPGALTSSMATHKAAIFKDLEDVAREEIGGLREHHRPKALLFRNRSAEFGPVFGRAAWDKSGVSNSNHPVVWPAQSFTQIQPSLLARDLPHERALALDSIAPGQAFSATRKWAEDGDTPADCVVGIAVDGGTHDTADLWSRIPWQSSRDDRLSKSSLDSDEFASGQQLFSMTHMSSLSEKPSHGAEWENLRDNRLQFARPVVQRVRQSLSQLPERDDVQGMQLGDVPAQLLTSNNKLKRGMREKRLSDTYR